MSRYSNPYSNPHNIKKELDDYVQGQGQGTLKIAMAISQHLLQSQYASDSPTDSVLLIGPTGCGKTETFRCLQRLERRLKCPVLMANVLDYAATNSWQGCSITDIFTQIFQRAATLYYSLYDDDNDDESPEEQKSNIIKIANRAIVLLDEADKISLGGEGKSLQFLKEYQSNLLKIVEGNTYPISDFSGKRTISDVGPDGKKRRYILLIYPWIPLTCYSFFLEPLMVLKKSLATDWSENNSQRNLNRHPIIHCIKIQ